MSRNDAPGLGDQQSGTKEDDPAGGRSEGLGLLPETVRKALVGGLGALFLTEESLRTLAREMRLPKEAVGYLLKHADQAKDQMLETVTKELRTFLESVNLAEELQKILSSVVLEVKTEIRLVPSEDGLVKPKLSTSVQARRTKSTD